MSFGESLRIASHGLMANKMRSALTMLGILIGVGAVIMLVAVGNGSSQAVQKQIESLGTNTLIVRRGFGGFGGGGFGGGGGNFGGRSRLGTQSQVVQLNLADVKALRDDQNAPDVKAVAPTITATATGSYQGATYSPSSFIGTSPEYEEIRNYSVASGAFFTKQDVKDHARVVVLGQTAVTNLFGATNPVGARLKFGNATFEVVGVLARRAPTGCRIRTTSRWRPTPPCRTRSAARPTPSTASRWKPTRVT